MIMEKGFSLGEALIVLLIIGICALLTPPLFVRKYEKEAYEVHGSYECLMGGGTTETYRDVNGKIKSQKSVSQCVFKPPLGSHDYFLDICGTHAEFQNCNYYDGSHLLKYYPTLKKSYPITNNGQRIYFGDIAFAFYRAGQSRVLIVY